MRKFYTTLREEENGAEGQQGGMGGDEVVTPSWYYQAPNEEAGTQGVGGNGEVPEWYNPKFKSVEEQAKGYGELEKRFGGFTGAPEAYELPEGINSDDPLISKMMEFGKSKQMGNDTFKEMLSLYNETMASENEKVMQQAMVNLGENAEQRVRDVNNWINTNLDTETVKLINEPRTPDNEIKIIEAIIAKTKNTPVAPHDVSKPSPMTEAEYAEQLMAKDASGNLKIATDPEYKKKMDAITAQRMNK